MKPDDRQLWMITVGGYGTFIVRGTEEEAEQARIDKVTWEGTSGRKERVPKELEQLVCLGTYMGGVVGSVMGAANRSNGHTLQSLAGYVEKCYKDGLERRPRP